MNRECKDNILDEKSKEKLYQSDFVKNFKSNIENLRKSKAEEYNLSEEIDEKNHKKLISKGENELTKLNHLTINGKSI